MKHRFITFLTDFGLTDDFVGTCHGVIKRIAPDVEIIEMDEINDAFKKVERGDVRFRYVIDMSTLPE